MLAGNIVQVRPERKALSAGSRPHLLLRSGATVQNGICG